MNTDIEISKTQPLVQEADDTATDDPNADYGCCHPGRTPYRYVVLTLICLVGIGDYFVLDNPAALEDQILDVMDINVAQYMLFYSAVMWVQIATSVLSGYLIDKVLGNRLSLVIGAFVNSMSQAIFALGALVNSFWVMCLGRMIYGISLGIAATNMTVRWFKSKELNMVLGLKLGIARAGSVAQMNGMGLFYEYISKFFSDGNTILSLTLHVGTAVCLVSFLCCVVLFFLDKRGENYCLNKELLGTTGSDVRLANITEFPVTFWLAALLISCFYWSVFTFVGIGEVFFEKKYEKERVAAANINSLAYLISIFAMPVSGWLIDKVGRSLYWLFLGLVLGLISHILLAFTITNPYIPMSILGISYSITTTALWPMVPYMVELKYCATAFGIVRALVSIGQAVITYLAGYLAAHNGYLMVEVLFIAGICVSLILSSVIYLIDRRTDGILNLTVQDKMPD